MIIAICDDDKALCEKLRRWIVEFYDMNRLKLPELRVYNSGEALLEKEEVIDIAFLDVEMGGMSGIHTGDAIKKRNKKALIFIITSYIGYLDEAMKFKVFRYLTKPVDKNRLFSNLKDAIAVYASENRPVIIETKNGAVRCQIEDIVLIEAEGKYTKIQTLTEQYTSVNNMQYWEVQLKDAFFFRTHRSFFVNLKYVDGYRRDIIELGNGQFVAYISKRKSKEFKDAFFSYVEIVG